MDSPSDHLLAAALKLPRTARETLVRRLEESLRQGRREAAHVGKPKQEAPEPLPSGHQVTEDFRAGRISEDEFIAAINRACDHCDTSLDPGVRALRDASLPKEPW